MQQPRPSPAVPRSPNLRQFISATLTPRGFSLAAAAPSYKPLRSIVSGAAVEAFYARFRRVLHVNDGGTPYRRIKFHSRSRDEPVASRVILDILHFDVCDEE